MRRPPSTFLLAAAAAVLLCAASPSQGHWVEAWYSPPFPPTAVLSCNDARVLDHQTVRQVIRVEAGGTAIRVRFSNELGLSAVKIGSAHVALSSPNGVTEPATDHALTFNGRPDAVIAQGKALLSDPVQLSVTAFADLAVSIYYPQRLAPAGHLGELRLSAPGDHGAEPVWRGSSVARAPGLVSGIEVQMAQARPVLVAFGDSITEGAGATPGTHMDWPEQLARRIAHSEASNWVVINSGISGNRLLHAGAGPSALDRFERDVLDIPGVKAVIVLEGINDIGWAFDPAGDTGPLTAQDLIHAYWQLISRAHARGLEVFGGTLTPYEDAVYYHPAGERVREAVNEWIRTSGAFDAVIDFDKAVRDPRDPLRYRGADQSGDSLHPNDAGYRAMSEAIDLKLLGPR